MRWVANIIPFQLAWFLATKTPSMFLHLATSTHQITTHLLKVAHITDLHLGEPDEIYLGLDHRQRLLSVLAEAAAQQPDFYVLGGDYSMHDPNPDACRWLKSQLDGLAAPYYLLAGNHDDTQQLAEIFELTLRNNYLEYVKETAHHRHIFLDSCKGTVTEEQMNWLGKQLDTDLALVLWMHHPPCPVGANFMDRKHSLRNWSPLMEQLESIGQAISVFTGHYHANLRFREGNVSINVCPPTSFYISPAAATFQQEHYAPAYQLVYFGENRELVVPRYVNQ